MKEKDELKELTARMRSIIDTIFCEYTEVHKDCIISSPAEYCGNEDTCTVFGKIKEPCPIKIFFRFHYVKGFDIEAELLKFFNRAFYMEKTKSVIYKDFYEELFREILNKINRETIMYRFIYKRASENT